MTMSASRGVAWSANNPEGMSIATVSASLALMARMAAAYAPTAGLLRPMPKMASTTSALAGIVKGAFSSKITVPVWMSGKAS